MEKLNLSRHDPVRTLRIVSSLAIIIYAYDVLTIIINLVNPAAFAKVAGVEAGAAIDPLLGTYATVMLVLSLIISLLEVHGGLEGLKGHSSKIEVRICAAVAIYAGLAIVLIASSGTGEWEELLEAIISFVIAFLLWHSGRREVRLHKATIEGARANGATEEQLARIEADNQHHTWQDYSRGMQVVGALMFLFTCWTIVQAAALLVATAFPSNGVVSIESESGVSVTLVIVTLVVEILLALVQLAIARAAFSGRVSTGIARLSLGTGLVLALGLLITIVSNGFTSLGHVDEVSNVGTLILCWVYYCKMLKLDAQG